MAGISGRRVIPRSSSPLPAFPNGPSRHLICCCLHLVQDRQHKESKKILANNFTFFLFLSCPSTSLSSDSTIFYWSTTIFYSAAVAVTVLRIVGADVVVVVFFCLFLFFG